ncbi:DciA family protein [Acidihalobacter yilgarnensis]|uniref:DciA family protein n=1 Tax=Acidihalobacter yilgarnensis TaxID=2819280 RepID=UPI0009F4CA0A
MQHASQFLPAALLERAKRMARISSMLKSALTPELSAHVWFAGIEGDTAQLLTDSGSWVAPLRFQQQLLLERLNGVMNGPTCTRISIRVVPEGLPANS